MEIYLPRIDSLRFIIGRDDNNYTKESYEIIDMIYEEMDCIKVSSYDEGKSIYVKYERGDFNDYKRLYDLNIKSKKKYKEEYEEFLKEYYMEYDWVEVEIHKYKEYKTIVINNDIIISVVPKEERKGFEYDITKFLIDLYKKIKYSINLIKNKTYYEKLCNEISYRQRTGIIRLDDIFNLNDEWKKDYYKYLSNEDIEMFLKNIDKQIKYSNMIDKEAAKYKDDYQKYFDFFKKEYEVVGRIEKMSGNDYYEICKLCYKSIGLEGVNELSSKDLFYKYADGRDCGLKDIDLNSFEAFDEWVNRANDHAFEIRMGSSTSRIDLWVDKDDNGYNLILSGKYLWISNEVIKFYLELTKNNVPVFLRDANVIRDRLIGKGLVGIVPYKVFPRYCQSLFDIDICDFVHLPYYPKDYNKFLKYIKWQEIPNTYLKDK